MIQTILLILLLIFIVSELFFKFKSKEQKQNKIDTGLKLDHLQDYSIDWEGFYEWQIFISAELNNLKAKQ